MKLFILSLFISAPAIAFQQTDYTCVKQCMSNGSTQQYCINACSYGNLPTIHNVDFQCKQACLAQGYGYMYCESSCSY